MWCVQSIPWGCWLLACVMHVEPADMSRTTAHPLACPLACLVFTRAAILSCTSSPNHTHLQIFMLSLAITLSVGERKPSDVFAVRLWWWWRGGEARFFLCQYSQQQMQTQATGKTQKHYRPRQQDKDKQGQQLCNKQQPRHVSTSTIMPQQQQQPSRFTRQPPAEPSAH